MQLPVYLDYHATTPIDPRVLDAMLPYLKEDFGNSHSSTHAYGWRAEQAVEKARGQVAKAIGASTPGEIVFTSGATESNNLAIVGVMRANNARGKHIVTANIEHKAVLDCAKHLESVGFSLTVVPVDEYGCVSPEKIRAAIRPDTVLVSVMAANNEIGTINPIRAIGAVCREKVVYFHTDAVQGVGKMPIDVEKDNIDLLSMSAHKVYGPKGVGALYVRRKNPRVEMEGLFFGGGHERGLRSGTLNSPGIVGLGVALEILVAEHESDKRRIGALRDKLLTGLQKRIPDLILNGHPTERLYNNINISIPYVAGESLLAGLRELAVSSGSACNSGSHEASYVLTALGRSADLARASLRFGLGRFTTEAEVDFALEKVAGVTERLRANSPLYQMRR